MLRVLTRVLAVQMGKEGHISEMLCRTNLQAAERELGCEPGGGTRRRRCPGDSAERWVVGRVEGRMQGWVERRMERWMGVWVEGRGGVELSETEGSPRGRGKRWAAVS